MQVLPSSFSFITRYSRSVRNHQQEKKKENNDQLNSTQTQSSEKRPTEDLKRKDVDGVNLKKKYRSITKCWDQLLPTTPFIPTINYSQQT